MITCPKRKSKRFYYVTRNYDYSYVDSVENNCIELLGVQDSVPDDEYENKLWCKDCGAKFSAEEINQVVNLNKEN